jgi:hypothetical protein
VVTGGVELAQHRPQVAQRREQVLLAGPDDPGADGAQLVERAEHRHQLVVLLAQHPDRRPGGVDRVGDHLLLAVERAGEAGDGLHRPDDLCLLAVQGAHDVGQVAEQRLEPLLPAVHHVVELAGDGAQLRHAAAAEEVGQRAEHLLDLRVATGGGQLDAVAVLEPADRFTGRGLEGDVLLTEQRDLPDVGDGVVGQLDVVAHAQRHPRVPADALDVDDLADRHVVDHHRGPRDDVEHVGEVRGHLERLVGVDRRARQRQS